MGIEIKDNATVALALPLPFNCLDLFNPMIANTVLAIILRTPTKPLIIQSRERILASVGVLIYIATPNKTHIITIKIRQSMLHVKLHAANLLLGVLFITNLVQHFVQVLFNLRSKSTSEKSKQLTNMNHILKSGLYNCRKDTQED